MINKPEARELHLLAKQRVRANDNIDIAGLHAGFDISQVLGSDHARSLRDLDRQTFEALGERAEVLTRKKRCWHDDRDLQAVHGGDERSAHGYFRLAEADVAAHEAVHGAAGTQVLDDGVDACGLILGFFIREARNEFVIWAGRRKNGRRLAQQTKGCNLDEFVGNFAQTLLEPRLA